MEWLTERWAVMPKDRRVELGTKFCVQEARGSFFLCLLLLFVGLFVFEDVCTSCGHKV